MSVIKPWLLAFLAVAGAFFIAGLTGSLVTDVLGFWHLPGAGFAAALAVVTTTFFAAPTYKFQLSCLALVVGALVAWIILEPSSYPEMKRYGDLAYQPTHLPFIATFSGGILGAVVAFLLRSRTSA
jgi:hypothetical protein